MWLAGSLGALLLAAASVRFPDVTLLALLPAVAAMTFPAIRPERHAWMTGLLPAAFLAWLPGSTVLALTVALLPAAAWLGRRFTGLRAPAFALGAVPVAAYLTAAAAAGSFALPFRYPLDLCAAVAFGATLCVLAYAPTQRERPGTRGRAGSRIR